MEREVQLRIQSNVQQLMHELGMTQDLILLLALDLEYRLTVTMGLSRDDKVCAEYFINRREVLIPTIMRLAHDQNKDPVDIFADYARRVHDRHLLDEGSVS